MHLAKTLLICAITLGAIMAVARGDSEECDILLSHECKDNVQTLVVQTTDNLTWIVPTGCTDKKIYIDHNFTGVTFEFSYNCDLKFIMDEEEECFFESACEVDSDDGDDNVALIVGVVLGVFIIIVIVIVVIAVVVVCSGSRKHSNDDVFQDDGSSFSISDESSDGGYSDDGSGGDDD